MNKQWLANGFFLSFVIFLVGCGGAVEPQVTQLVSYPGSTAGSTVGDDGALYVTEREVGEDSKILRVDPQTGVVTEFASGLPIQQISEVSAVIGPNMEAIN